MSMKKNNIELLNIDGLDHGGLDAVENFDDCPFSYTADEDQTEIIHPIIGICAYCGQNAYTQSPVNNHQVACWSCAYHYAN